MITAFALLTIAVASFLSGWSQPAPKPQPNRSDAITSLEQFIDVQTDARALKDMEQKDKITPPGFATVEDKIEQIDWLFAHAQPVEAINELIALQAKITADKDFVRRKLAELGQAKAVRAKTVAPSVQPAGKTIPILLYHKTPANFESQLLYLKSHNYTTISMAQVSCGLRNSCILPPKPVVITYDDGFSDQMSAFNLLEKYSMRGTFYMIIGGERSKYCIGIERQPGAPCGDSYMNWDEVKRIAASPLMEIGAHTIDHLALASLNAADQTFQIAESKRRLEQALGIPITTLAYPYGSFNALSAQIAQQSGFSTAVTTIAGTEQSPSTLYTLRRVRDVYHLP